MPKILDSMREQLLAAARRQVESNGYAKTTIRSIAAECGIAVGTVYNYFPSKDMLIATFVSEDWRACIAPIASRRFHDAQTRLRAVYDAIRTFTDSYRVLFSDDDAKNAYYAAFSQRHGQLREQLAALILPACGDEPDCAFLSEFIAESLLTWTLEGRPFEDIYQLIQR
ncbi:MAG: TetR/AcrR family transcriptional regulator, partial [Clostridia bacterium]|nr:TetR/AcrR family transcriptional regulator [Clostridia bacterium]